jgi:hypothetical protein
MRDHSLWRAGRGGGAQLLPIAAAALLVTFAAAAPVAAQVAVYPAVVNLNPSAGVETVTSVFVRNEGATMREFRFEIQDFDQDSVGIPRFMTLGEHAQSCSDRIAVYPAAATLAPGETQELRLSVTGAATVCWAALFAEARSAVASGIVARQQVGVRINVVPPRAVLDGEITRLEVDMRGEPALQLWFRNTGSAPVRPAGLLEVRDAAGTVVASADVAAFSVLPGQTRRVAVPFTHTLAAGRYTAVPVLDFGGDYLAGGQAAFVVR